MVVKGQGKPAQNVKDGGDMKPAGVEVTLAGMRQRLATAEERANLHAKRLEANLNELVALKAELERERAENARLRAHGTKLETELAKRKAEPHQPELEAAMQHVKQQTEQYKSTVKGVRDVLGDVLEEMGVVEPRAPRKLEAIKELMVEAWRNLKLERNQARVLAGGTKAPLDALEETLAKTTAELATVLEGRASVANPVEAVRHLARWIGDLKEQAGRFQSQFGVTQEQLIVLYHELGASDHKHALDIIARNKARAHTTDEGLLKERDGLLEANKGLAKRLYEIEDHARANQELKKDFSLLEKALAREQAHARELEAQLARQDRDGDRTDAGHQKLVQAVRFFLESAFAHDTSVDKTTPYETMVNHHRSLAIKVDQLRHEKRVLSDIRDGAAETYDKLRTKHFQLAQTLVSLAVGVIGKGAAEHLISSSLSKED